MKKLLAVAVLLAAMASGQTKPEAVISVASGQPLCGVIAGPFCATEVEYVVYVTSSASAGTVGYTYYATGTDASGELHTYAGYFSREDNYAFIATGVVLYGATVEVQEVHGRNKNIGTLRK